MTAEPALAMVPGFDVEATRKDFPILSREVYGKPLTYLDNAASAQKPQVVLDAVQRGFGDEYANVHRGLHYLSNKSTERYEEARKSIQTFLGAPSPEQIILTSGATDSINLVAASFLEPQIEEGDEIILSIMEHHSNIVPWHFLRERFGAVLKWVDVDDRGALHIDDFKAALSPRTKFVAITHMSNALGTVTPLKEIIDLAHAHGVPVLADGSQAAVHIRPDVAALDVDFYAITGHKLYGPSGIGALYAKKDRLEAMRPYRGGGEMIHEVTKDAISYASPPHRFEAGTPPIVEAIGLGVALDYMMALDWAAVKAHEDDLITYSHERARELNWLKINGEAPGKAAIFAFTIDGIHPHDISTYIDRQGVAVRAGHHCAQPLMTRFDVPATSRASFALYNTREDVDRLFAALIKCREFFG